MTPGASVRIWLLGGAVFAGLESAVIWLRVQAAPLAWMCLIWILLCLALATWGSPRRRGLWLNLAAALTAVGLVEGALWISKARNPYAPPPGVRIEGSFYGAHGLIEAPSPGLGYRPRANASATAIRRDHGKVVYAVRYTTGPDGLRVAPPSRLRPSSCLLMFGDSFAWGEGVDDWQTAAFQVGALSAGMVHVANFAFTGYGPHQMLWQTDSGAVARAAGCPPSQPVLAVYQTLPNNVGRVAGLRGWDIYGPRYRLDRYGKLHYAGGFRDGDSILHDRVFVPPLLADVLSRSELYNRILGQDRRPDAFDLDRFCAVVEASRQDLRRLYPRLRFLVIVWPDLEEGVAGPRTAQTIACLRRHGLDVRPAGQALPGYDANPWPSHIPGDGHPSAETHRRLALYLLQHELPVPQTAAAGRPHAIS